MPDTITPAPTTAASAAPAANPTPASLCRQIELTLPREANDRVKCTHISGSRYRCNWWSTAPADPKADRREIPAAWAVTASQRIRKSSFLSATLDSAGKLKIEELPAPARAE